MAIYSEETDPNEKVKTNKDLIIEKINEIIKEYGNFTKWERKPTHQLCCGWDESDPTQK